MKIHPISVVVDDQDKALDFFTGTLGFVKKFDMPMAEFRWLTVVPAENPKGPDLVLEPDKHPAAKQFKEAIVADGIPYASFAVDDAKAYFERLTGLGVTFTQQPTTMGPVTTAVFDDICGSLIQIASINS